MQYKVINRQYRSDNCLVCGFANEFGLDMDFWELENGELAARIQTKQVHQSYPGRTHGGIISAMLDEVVGRAISITEPSCWGVTTELNVKFRQPVPLEAELLIVGRITRNRSRMFSGSGEIYLPDGTLLAEATATYLKMPVEKIVEGGELSESSWRLHTAHPQPEYIELPY